MNLNILKKELEKALLISKWSPSAAELEKIAKHLKEFKGEPSKANIGNIVLAVVGSYEAQVQEGIDNSDLTTLLLLATKAAESDE